MRVNAKLWVVLAPLGLVALLACGERANRGAAEDTLDTTPADAAPETDAAAPRMPADTAAKEEVPAVGAEETGAPRAEGAASDSPAVQREAAELGSDSSTPVVVYFKQEPSETDLEWLRTNGFVVERVQRRIVSGHFERQPPPEFRDDPRLSRIVPLQRPAPRRP